MSSITRAHRLAQAPQPDAWNLYADRGDASDVTEVSRERRPQPTRPSPMRPVINPPLSLWEKALVWLMVLIVMVIGWTVFGTYEALADDSTPPPTVRVSALSVGTLTPLPTETPELLPATTVTLEVDADTLAPSTVKPARLAATGGPDLPSVAGFALVVVVVTGLGMRWVLR